MKDAVREESGALAGKVVLLLGLWGAAAMFMALFLVKGTDITAAREEVLRERSPSPDIAGSAAPRVFRRDFEFRLPIPGERRGYQWKVKGRESVSVDASTDKILQFKGTMIDRGDAIDLSSPAVLFDKEKRVLSSQDGVVLWAPWAKIEASAMVMDMRTTDTYFSGGVTTQIDREQAERRQEANKPSPTPKETPPKPAQKDEKPKKEKKLTPLVITSKELRLVSKENLAVFMGEVVAKDESGSIYADKMEAYNYSEEETKQDPKLKGVKRVICTGDVKIDQVEGKKQALCARAEYDAKTNMIHLYHDPKTGKKVVYRDEEQKWQAEAEQMILDRTKNEVKFVGQVKTIDYSPDRKSFLGFMEPAKSKQDKPTTAPAAGK